MALQETLGNQKLILQKPKGSFYAAWILLTDLCIPVAFVISLLVLGMISRLVGDFVYVDGVQYITEDYLALYILFPVLGLLTGLAQYGLLRRLLPRMGGWVLATTVGWILALILYVFLSWLNAKVPNHLDLYFLMLGLSIGLAQWLVIRQKLPGAFWWVPATLLGWGLLALITSGSGVDQFGLLIMGLLPACTTAAALWWMLRQA